MNDDWEVTATSGFFVPYPFPPEFPHGFFVYNLEVRREIGEREVYSVYKYEFMEWIYVGAGTL